MLLLKRTALVALLLRFLMTWIRLMQERQPATVPELPYNQPYQSPEQSHAEDLKIILNRLKSQAEKIITEEQAGFRAGRSTTEQIFNLCIRCEK